MANLQDTYNQIFGTPSDALGGSSPVSNNSIGTVYDTIFGGSAQAKAQEDEIKKKQALWAGLSTAQQTIKTNTNYGQIAPTITQKVINTTKNIAKGFISGVPEFGQSIAAPFQAGILEKENSQLAQQQQSGVKDLINRYKAEQNPVKKEQIKGILANYSKQNNLIDVFGAVPALNKSAEQVLGEAGSTLLNILSAGTFGKAKGAATIAKTLATGAGWGAGYGLTGGMQQNSKGAELAKSVGLGAAGGTVLSGVGRIIGVAGQKLSLQELNKTLDTASSKVISNILAKNGIAQEQIANLANQDIAVQRKAANWILTNTVKEMKNYSPEAIRAASGEALPPPSRTGNNLMDTIQGIAKPLETPQPLTSYQATKKPFLTDILRGEPTSPLTEKPQMATNLPLASENAKNLTIQPKAPATIDARTQSLAQEAQKYKSAEEFVKANNPDLVISSNARSKQVSNIESQLSSVETKLTKKALTEGVFKSGGEASGRPIPYSKSDQMALDNYLNKNSEYATLKQKRESVLSDAIKLERTKSQLTDFYNQATPLGEALTTPGTKVAKAANDIYNKFDTLPPEERAKYDAGSYKQDSITIATLMENNIKKAEAMGAGEIPTEGIKYPQILFETLGAKATKEGDIALAQRLMKSPLATYRSEAAGTLGSSGYNNDPHNGVRIMQELQARKIESLGGGEKLAPLQEKIQAEIVPKFQSEMRANALTGKGLTEFIQSIKC